MPKRTSKTAYLGIVLNLSFEQRNQTNSVGPLIVSKYCLDPEGMHSLNNQ